MNKLKIIEFKNQRVLTTQQLAESYGTTNQIITNNFNRNKERYLEGKHYISLEGEMKKEFIDLNQIELGSLKNAKTIYLWTERGAFLHAKSLNTDKAWEVYDSLVEHYFKTQVKALPTSYKEALIQLVAQVEENEKLQLENKEMQPKADYFDALVDRNLLTNFRDTANELKIGQKYLIENMIKDGYIYRNRKNELKPYMKYVEKGLFELKEFVNPYNGYAKPQTLITPKGRETFRLLYKNQK